MSPSCCRKDISNTVTGELSLKILLHVYIFELYIYMHICLHTYNIYIYYCKNIYIYIYKYILGVSEANEISISSHIWVASTTFKQL